MKSDDEKITLSEEKSVDRSRIGIMLFTSIGGLIILAAIITAIVTPGIARNNRDNAELNAMATLLELARLEVEYSQINGSGHFANLTELQAEGMVDSTRSETDLINHFDLVFTIQRKTYSGTGILYARNMFTIIAIPKINRSDYMSQYGIREDGKIRRFVPGQSQPNDVLTWIPINDTSEFPDVSLNPLN